MNTTLSKGYFFYLKILILLNIIDGIATYIGHQFKIITELNPIMKNVVSNAKLFLVIKIFIPTIIIIGIYILLKKTKNYRENLIMSVCLVSVSIYLLVICLHSYWIINYFIILYF